MRKGAKKRNRNEQAGGGKYLSIVVTAKGEYGKGREPMIDVVVSLAYTLLGIIPHVVHGFYPFTSKWIGKVGRWYQTENTIQAPDPVQMKPVPMGVDPFMDFCGADFQCLIYQLEVHQLRAKHGKPTVILYTGQNFTHQIADQQGARHEIESKRFL